ncbi:MAG TPA: hypothetical protein VF074_08130 [Pyrinomonadaceae bacterium]
MKANNKLFATLGLLVFLASTVQAAGQRRGPTSDPSFNAFWVQFKDAIAKNDKNRVADLTKLPFMLRNIDQDRAGFIKEYPSLFTPRMRRCIPRAKVTKEYQGDGYEIFCGELIFYFSKVDGVWKFTEVGVND